MSCYPNSYTFFKLIHIYTGCLGHGDWQSLSVPKLVESLLTVDISAVACGSGHVVIVGRKGDVYSWGRGSLGRLGLGNEEDCCTPQEVIILSMQCDSIYTEIV